MNFSYCTVILSLMTTLDPVDPVHRQAMSRDKMAEQSGFSRRIRRPGRFKAV
jgi:hypothetical protein